MNLIENARRWANAFKAAPVERKIADMLTNKDGLIDDKFSSRVDGKPFTPGISYFGIRLSGLHLVDARRFTKLQSPLCVCLVEFENAGQRRTIPFSIGPDVIRQRMKAAGLDDSSKAGWIELRDITVVRPTPVSEGNASLYTGLFSLPGDDLVKLLLDVVGTVGTALSQPALGAGLKVAETVYDSFGSLLGLNQVDEVAAALIGNVLTDLGSGYLLIANVDPNVFDRKRAQVVNGRLHWPRDQHEGKAVVEFDHVLLALEHYDTIIQKETGLAPALFQALWSAALAAPREQSAAALSRLQDAIASSPDLTEGDRIALLGGYSIMFEKISKARWPDAVATSTRGDDGAKTLSSKMISTIARLDEFRSRESEHELDTLRSIAEVFESQENQPLQINESTDQDGVAEVLDAASAIRNALGNSGKVSPELVQRVIDTATDRSFGLENRQF